MIQFKLIIGIIWFAKFVLKYIYTQNLKVKKKKKKNALIVTNPKS